MVSISGLQHLSLPDQNSNHLLHPLPPLPMIPTPAMTQIPNGLHLRPPTPASQLRFSLPPNKQNTEKNMLDHDPHKHQLDLTPWRRKNAKRLKTGLLLSDTERRKNLNKT